MAIKLPKTVGTVADNLYKLRDLRLKLQREVDAIKGVERELTDHGIGLLHQQRLTAGRGKLATFSITQVSVATATDWDALYEWIVDNDAFDVLQRRLNNKAVIDRSEDIAVEGVKIEGIIKASLTKAKG